MSGESPGGGDELAEARRALRRLRGLLEHTADPCWAVDAELRLVAFNRAFARHFGGVRRPVVGLGMLQCMPESSAEAVAAAFRAAAEGDAQSASCVLGEGIYARTFDVRVVMLQADGGAELAATAREASSRLAADDRVARARDAAEAASQAKSDFLAHISHEIRTPLNAIVGMTDLALDTDLSDRQRRLLGSVRHNTEALLHLVHDILDFSKIEAGQMELGSEPFLPAESVHQVVEFLAVSASRKGLRLVSDVAPECGVAVRGDPDRFRQIVTNLVSNAIKYTLQGEIIVRLRVRADAAGRPDLVLSVIDTGVGIAAEDQAQVFSRFFRAGRPGGKRTSGTGLGLSITRSLVSLMGGRIDLRSEVGRGSLFRVRLPLAMATEQPERPSLAGVRVLIADPHPIARGWAAMAVKAAGGAAVAVSSLQEAVAAVVAGAPHDAALIDQDLDDPDGLARHLKQRAGARGCRTVLIVDPTRSFVGGEGTFDVPLLRPASLASLRAALLGGLPEWTTATSSDATERPRRAPVLATPGAPQGTRPPDPPQLRRPAHVLLVEDSVDNQQFAMAVVGGAGHRVSLARDGREAVAAARHTAFDVVLMDVHMPVMDGVEATTHIRNEEVLHGRARVPIVAFTAHATDGVRQRCLRAGMDDFLTKPVSADRLLGSIDRWSRRALRVLVADDDVDMRALLREWLEGAGAEVLFATQGEEAVRAARTNAVDLVLMDMQMPVLDGFQAARQLRNLPATADVPLLAVTGAEGEAVRRRCLAAGCVAVIVKPTTRAAVLAAISSALRVPEPTPGRSVDPDIADLVPAYVDNRLADIARAREELGRQGFSEVQRIGHSMKGSGAPYGYPELTGLGAALEEAAERRDAQSAGAILERIAALMPVRATPDAPEGIG